MIGDKNAVHETPQKFLLKWIVGLCAFGAIFEFGVIASAQDTWDEQVGKVLRVTILDSSGVPIPKAKVSLLASRCVEIRVVGGAELWEPESLEPARTDKNGCFSFEILKYMEQCGNDGEIIFEASAKGRFPAAWVWSGKVGFPIEQEIVLHRTGGEIAGRVTEIPPTWTQPLVVVAMAYLEDYIPRFRGRGSSYFWRFEKCQIGADGRFRFENLSPARYLLVVLNKATVLLGDVENSRNVYEFSNLAEGEVEALDGSSTDVVDLVIRDNIIELEIQSPSGIPVTEAMVRFSWFKFLRVPYFSGEDGMVYVPLYSQTLVGLPPDWAGFSVSHPEFDTILNLGIDCRTGEISDQVFEMLDSGPHIYLSPEEPGVVRLRSRPIADIGTTSN